MDTGETLFRPAIDSDLGALYRLETECFGDEAYPPQLLLFYMKIPRSLFIVAHERPSNRIIGYVIGVIEREAIGHVISICVDPGYRRRGLGTTLMRLIEEFFLREGVCESRLEVRTDNQSAINMYKRLGYETRELLRRYYRDGSDAYVMVKRLCRDYERSL